MSRIIRHGPGLVIEAHAHHPLRDLFASSVTRGVLPPVPSLPSANLVRAANINATVPHVTSLVNEEVAIVATHSTNGAVDRSRPLCPYPQVAHYSGKGDSNDAANFVCGAPK